jgi:hypothetical protein
MEHIYIFFKYETQAQEKKKTKLKTLETGEIKIRL